MNWIDRIGTFLSGVAVGVFAVALVVIYEIGKIVEE